MKLNNIRLLVNNFDQCYSFYKDVLGLKCTWGAPGENYASFDAGRANGLSIFRGELMNGAFNSNEIETASAKSDKVVLVFEVSDVDKEYDSYQLKGIRFLNAPKDMPGWGIRVVHMRDPEDNLIELYSELSKEKWGDDLLEDEKKYNN